MKCENDFYYYEYEDSDDSMVGVLGINFPSFVDTHVDDFLRNCIKEIVVPEEIDGETVRGCGLFSDCENLKSVTMLSIMFLENCSGHRSLMSIMEIDE